MLLLYIFLNLFKVWFQRWQTFIPAFEFNLKQYIVLVEVYKENSVSHRYVDRKERTTFWIDNWEHYIWHYPKIQQVVVSYNLMWSLKDQ